MGGYLGAMQKAKIYTTTYCSFCQAATSFFKAKNIVFEEIDVTGDDAAREVLQERTGRHTVPQIWIGEIWVGGYDDLRALERSGGLAPLLASPA